MIYYISVARKRNAAYFVQFKSVIGWIIRCLWTKVLLWTRLMFAGVRWRRKSDWKCRTLLERFNDAHEESSSLRHGTATYSFSHFREAYINFVSVRYLMLFVELLKCNITQTIFWCCWHGFNFNTLIFNFLVLFCTCDIGKIFYIDIQIFF